MFEAKGRHWLMMESTKSSEIYIQNLLNGLEVVIKDEPMFSQASVHFQIAFLTLKRAIELNYISSKDEKDLNV